MAITCYCEAFELSQDEWAADNGMCVCGHFEREHVHEGDGQVCTNTGS